MRQFSVSRLDELFMDHEPPCVSLYQPTHRHYPDNQQDPIRYRNLLKELEASLARKYAKREVHQILEKFQELSHDGAFWNHRTDGLGILATSDSFHVFELQRTTPELLIVADSFHLKPLLWSTQSLDRFQILCLDRHSASLYEGNRDTIDPVELTDVPSTIAEALGEELTEPYHAVAAHGGVGGVGISHGQGAKKDEVDVDMERFFRVIDQGILEHHSQPSGLPLMLAALPEYHTPFRAISRNPNLMVESIIVNPFALAPDKLRAEAWGKIEPFYLERVAKLVDEFQSAKSRELGSDNLTEIAASTVAGRVGLLLLEANREIPGRILPETGEVQSGVMSDPETGDVLDDLAARVVRMNGQVVVVPAETMPSDTGLAAVYRF